MNNFDPSVQLGLHLEYQPPTFLTNNNKSSIEGRTGGSLARFTNRKNRGSRITDTKISFSRITKTSKQYALFNNLFLHQKQCFRKAKSGMAKLRLHIANRTPKLLCIDDSNHSEDLRLKNHVELSGKYFRFFTFHAKPSVHKSRRIIS